jgi:hypothetical protein
MPSGPIQKHQKLPKQLQAHPNLAAGSIVKLWGHPKTLAACIRHPIGPPIKH